MSLDLRRPCSWRWWVVASLGVAGCGFIGQAIHASSVPYTWFSGYESEPPVKTKNLRAGVGSGDITPPAGYPTGGHGPAGAVSRGQWLPLKVRAFFFGDTDGRNLVLVSTDLFALPGGLHTGVTNAVAARLQAAGVHIALPREAVIIAATHTHQGPGNFLTAKTQNDYGSSWPGFSARLFNLLVDRISAAIVAAILDAQKTGKIQLVFRSARVDHELVRSRAPGPFLFNGNRSELLEEWKDDGEFECDSHQREPKRYWKDEGCIRLRAVDRALSTLEVRRDNQSIGVLVFFSVHPTVLEAGTPFYSPDFTGYAINTLERKRSLVAAYFNGADGDVVPRRTFRGLRDVKRLGNKFLDAIETSLDGGIEPDFDSSKWRAPLNISVSSSNRSPRHDECSSDAGTFRLAEEPMMGAPGLGGAEDDRTPLYYLGWRDGVTDRPANEQGVKLAALDSKFMRSLGLSELLAPPRDFPSEFPVAVLSIGPLRIAAIPLEMTSSQGALVRRVLSVQGRPRVEIIGLANEYQGYCTSWDEYSAQYYEGGETWWGPHEGEYVACRLRELAMDAGYPALGRPSDQPYFIGGSPSVPQEQGQYCKDLDFGPAFGGNVYRPDEGINAALSDREPGDPSLPWFRWNESEPQGCRYLWEYPERSVFIDEETEQGWRLAASSEAGDVLTIRLTRGVWSSIWLEPPERSSHFRFRVITREPGQVDVCSCSAPFTPDAGPTAVEGARCTELGGYYCVDATAVAR